LSFARVNTGIHIVVNPMQDEIQPNVCPRCRSNSLRWHLVREGRALRSAAREIGWLCRACGATWTEPIAMASEAIKLAIRALVDRREEEKG
jgi:hypothetical protein